MQVFFGQIYIKPGISFGFSHRFQTYLGQKVSALVSPSREFTERYGSDWELMFRISAKEGITENELRGPTVFRKDKDVEFTIFLPFDTIHRDQDVLQSAPAPSYSRRCGCAWYAFYRYRKTFGTAGVDHWGHLLRWVDG